MNTLFRIHTEATTPEHESVIHAAMSPFEAYNVIFGRGSWRGIGERSATIEVYGDASDYSIIRKIAEAIRAGNNQEAVLVSQQAVTTELL